MNRFGKYHLLAALGLVLAYHSFLGIIDSIQTSFYSSIDGGEEIAQNAAQIPAVVDTDPPELDPPAEMITHSSQSITPDLPAVLSMPVPATATPELSVIVPLTDALPEGTSNTQTLAEEPTRLVIPSIDLDAPVVPAKIRSIKFRGEMFQQWLAPTYHAAGWHTDSAYLGTIGNTVLNGHHNVFGAVFNRLVDLQAGDIIQVYSGSHLFVYQVRNRMIVPEKYQQMDTRMANLQWILPSQDERLTLITCWPDESNTHRLIIVAAPVERLNIETDLQ